MKLEELKFLRKECQRTEGNNPEDWEAELFLCRCCARITPLALTHGDDDELVASLYAVDAAYIVACVKAMPKLVRVAEAANHLHEFDRICGLKSLVDFDSRIKELKEALKELYGNEPSQT